MSRSTVDPMFLNPQNRWKTNLSTSSTHGSQSWPQAAIFPIKKKREIILTCKSKKLRADALTNPTWDLKALLEKATTYELTKMRAKQIEEGCSSAPSETVNKVGNKRNRFNKPQQNKAKADDKKLDQQKMCNFCGYNWHKKLNDCPAQREGVKCKSCGRPGHFAQACRSKSKGKSQIRKVNKKEDSSDDNSRDVEEFTNRVRRETETSSDDESSEEEEVIIKTTLGNKVHPMIKLQFDDV